MNCDAATSFTPPHREERGIGWFAAALLGLAFAAYANTWRAPFVYDDVQAITENASIRQLWPLTRVLMPLSERGLTVSGRPVLNLSLALNYAISGTDVWSYHVFNILIHAGAGLLLFGIVRRTLEIAAQGRRAQEDSAAAARQASRATSPRLVAFIVAALWLLHPLQTEAVTYIVQRAESLMGFFYLLTLYAFIRTLDGGASREWTLLTVAACALGMSTKEVMATAPLLVLLYDRTFVGGNFKAAWRQRRGLHLALASTWVLLAVLVASTGGNRGGTVGVGTGVPLWAYPLTQFKAIATYLALSVWPQPLVFEYGTFWVRRTSDVAPYALLVLPLLFGTIIALRRATALGFCGAWFFGILAPTSLAPGTIQMIVEHRMYLPLAAIVAVAGCGVGTVTNGRLGRAALVAVILAMGMTAYQRNGDYRSHLALWTDTVAKRPLNARAHQGLAEAYQEKSNFDAARREFTAAIRLQPDEATYHYNLGFVVATLGRDAEAVQHYEDALRLAPNEPRTHNNLGIALARLGRTDEALRHYAEAERLAPRDPQYAFNHGIALFRLGRNPAAIERYEAALRLNPRYADAHFNLATALATQERLPDALKHYAEAVQLAPRDAEIRTTFGGALLLAGQPANALEQFHAALQLAPANIEARFGEANALAALTRREEAIVIYERILREQPTHANAHFKLANALFDLDRVSEAAAHYEAALRVNPQDAEAHHNLGTAYARMERWNDARREFETALRLKPDYLDAQRHLEQLRRVIGL